ncbi:SDR family oxidoreductase [Pseudochryseolinea flava]|uniref:DUF2867 domain-containing protein n=1 Tax=Pseudochryseolinea flava TaxID=2059302 RepID=A0A364Y6P4_9BACT|nr:SDR family oxidoreductase [Pseudochryseolinea flava]RAW02573.1 DUF2867 domain-containing protein [Pseudochryseolinea flava]
MNILLTGSTGYIGRRLLPVLLDAGHHVFCAVRHRQKFDWDAFPREIYKNFEVLECDFSDASSMHIIPEEIDIAYYLLHSMSSANEDFQELEKRSAKNFTTRINQTKTQQIIYVSGIANSANLSSHLTSRTAVEDILRSASVPLTVLRAAIIIGSGSASFEIIRDLVEKLPVMIAPRWLDTRCQPIAIRNVLEYLVGVMAKDEALGKTFDIGGTDVLTYKEMLYAYAKARKLKRMIITVPVLTPRLSSMWLVFVTATSYALAKSLVDSMKNEVVCKDNEIQSIVPITLFSYRQALELAFDKISHKNIISSWKDSFYLQTGRRDVMNNIEVPSHGVLTDRREISFTRPVKEVIANLWSIGGKKGWYAGNWLWRIRGFADTIVGGVGIRRGRRSENALKTGDALDFWRVILADPIKGRLILYAEMKLPGEAWLEFTIKSEDQTHKLVQTATFRPLGLWGRLYWFSVLPFHALIFPRMAKAIVQS